jgi:P-type E1-E2 ATPase
LVNGDVIEIKVGLIIPCDGFIIEANSVEIDESAMTGESDIIKKNTLEECLK